MFKNLIPFRLANDWPLSVSDTAEALRRRRHQPCGPMDTRSMGWVPPLPGDDRFVISVGHHMLFRLQVEEKLLPSSVIQKTVRAMVAKIEKAESRKVGRKELRALKDAAIEELLPKAFVKERGTLVWVDTQGRWLGIDGGSHSKADEAMEALAKSVDPVPDLTLIKVQTSPAAAMSEWLTSQDAPAGFSVDDQCELMLPIESKATVRYVRHDLNLDEVRAHIAQGKQPTKLAMTHADRVSFVLTADLMVKKLQLLDLAIEETEQSDSETAEGRFDADFTLVAGEMTSLLHDLVEALGGERPDDGE